MSLKAKLEAIIYAAEEPVTLGQMAALFAGEALAWKEEQQASGLDSGSDPDPDDEPGPSDDSVPEDSTVELAELVEAVERPAGAEESESGQSLDDLPASADALIDGAPGDLEAEAKRLERKRNQDVRQILRGLIDELIADYADSDRGLEIREIAGGFRIGTKPEVHDAVRAFVKSLKPPMKLSLPALETLAVIAYKQPVTAPEVAEIRGVDSGGVLGSLISRKLITTAGRKAVIGRPILYKTTKEFLLRFGLKDLTELPSMEEFEKMAAIELNEAGEEEFAGPAQTASGNLFGDQGQEAQPEAEAASSGGTFTPGTEPHIPAALEEPGTSKEAAVAEALVERQNAEEIEVEQ